MSLGSVFARGVRIVATLFAGALLLGLLMLPPTAGAGGTVRCDGIVATIVGTSGADELDGTPGRDIIHGRGGSDDIEGKGGNDVICGGGGNDDIEGDAGSDRLFGQGGNDDIEGDRGNDFLNGGKGHDELDGGAGTDRCINGPVFESCERR
jgi:Ca2+-binding RTX toxin-like protein